MQQGLTTKRHREPRQRTEPLHDELERNQPNPMSGWEHAGKVTGIMWRAWRSGRV